MNQNLTRPQCALLCMLSLCCCVAAIFLNFPPSIKFLRIFPFIGTFWPIGHVYKLSIELHATPEFERLKKWLRFCHGFVALWTGVSLVNILLQLIPTAGLNLWYISGFPYIALIFYGSCILTREEQ